VNVKRGVHLGKGQLFPVPLEGRADIRSGLIAMPLLEGGIVRTSFKEVAKGSIQVTQGLLKRDTGDLIHLSAKQTVLWRFSIDLW
jgi:hypothetical protein